MKYEVTEVFYHKNRFVEVGETLVLSPKAAQYIGHKVKPVIEADAPEASQAPAADVAVSDTGPTVRENRETPGAVETTGKMRLRKGA